MEHTATWVGLTMIMLGVAGVFLTYSGVSSTFIHGMQAISALLLLLGIMVFAGGIARGGFPRISAAQLSAIGVAAYTSAALLTIAATTYYGPFALLKSEEPVTVSPIKVIIDIVPGSWDPQQPDNYIPKNVRVVLGVNNTVVWINKETLDVAHTVTHDNRLFDSGLFGPGMNWTYTFREAGEFRYHCIPHPWMRGSVVVEKLSPEKVAEILESLGVAKGE
jgi:hypothetical protein